MAKVVCAREGRRMAEGVGMRHSNMIIEWRNA